MVLEKFSFFVALLNWLKICRRQEWKHSLEHDGGVVGIQAQIDSTLWQALSHCQRHFDRSWNIEAQISS